VAGHPPVPLELIDVTRRFGRVTALSGVSLVVRHGAVVALVGPNGSGKSTLLGLAAGLLAPDEGTIAVAGARAGTVEARRRVAYVPDDPGGFDELTVREHLDLVGGLHGVRDSSRRVEVSTALGLVPLLDRRLGALSRGQRRRAALAAALALDPPLLLVDEATEALDEAAVALLGRELGRAARRGAGVLVASHDTTFVSAVCDAAVRLERGAVLEIAAVHHGDPVRHCEPVAV
jgi:ABC-type multidrug transport system ATPase subunit